MKHIFEKILSIGNSLNPQKQSLLIKLLEELSTKINTIILKDQSYKEQLAGIKKNTYDDNLVKAIDLLKLLGFSEISFIDMSPDFLNWMFANTVSNAKYQPKLMNYYLLVSMQEAYFMSYAENQGVEPTYKQVRTIMLTFNERIEEMEKTLKLSLPELIKKIDGYN